MTSKQDGSLRGIRVQLYILGMFRCTEAIAWTSIFAYVYPMLATFKEVEERRIPFYAGLLIAVFTFCEFLSGMMWARLADVIGRRWSLLLGCVGCIFTALMFGFATSLWVALLSRAIGGLSNPNTGVVNTCVGEIVTKKENQAKAFSIIPFFRSMGNILGPVLGGFLAKPNDRFPGVFRHKVWQSYPFLLPNLAVSSLAFLGLVVGILLLQETSPGFSDQRSLYEKITAKLRRVKYSSLAEVDPEVDPEVEELDLVAPERPEDIDGEEAHDTATPMKVGQPHTVLSDGETTKPKQALTPQVWLQILSVSSVAYHKVSSDIIMSTFLALPETSQRDSSPLQARGLNVSGGFGLTTSEIGTIFLSQAVVAVVAQSYLIPKLVSKMGALRVFKWILLAYPLLYILTPLTAKLPSPLSIIAVSIDLWIKVIVSSTAYVCSNILITNTTPDRKFLAKVNGAAASVGCFARAIGPSVSGQIFGWSMQIHHIELAFWSMSLVASTGSVESFFLRDRP